MRDTFFINKKATLYKFKGLFNSYGLDNVLLQSIVSKRASEFQEDANIHTYSFEV